jgi:hypothetical protein
VAWSDFRAGIDVFARRLPAGGAPSGAEFMVHQSPAGLQALGGVARAPDGRFVVAWNEFNAYDVLVRRFDASGAPVGDELRVNTNTTNRHIDPVVGIDRAGNFTVVWDDRDGTGLGEILGQRFGPSGERVGAEFIVNSYTTGQQVSPDIAMNGDGSAVITWEGIGPVDCCYEVWARRYSASGAPIGEQFRVTAAQNGPGSPSVAVDETGNFAIAWWRSSGPDLRLFVRRFTREGTPRSGDVQVAQAGDTAIAIPEIAGDPVGNFVIVWDDVGADDLEVLGRRYGGLLPAGLAVVDGGNSVLEVNESIGLLTSWRNVTAGAQTFQGRASNAAAPAGLSLSVGLDANYGTVADGAVGSCGASCMAGTLTGTRPAGHVDATYVETILPDAQGQAKRWVLHVGESFADVPRASGFYRFVETMLHQGVTAGCGGNVYCPASSTTRAQMAVFLLVAKEGASYVPPACTTPMFPDVPASDPFCRWIEELARRGITGGCGAGYCPADPVTREQMAVFVLRTLDPALNPPACTAPVFADVAASSPFCRWIEELARRGIVSGCGGGNYCPAAAVTREQMAVFLTGTFGLTLYGP